MNKKIKKNIFSKNFNCSSFTDFKKPLYEEHHTVYTLCARALYCDYYLFNKTKNKYWKFEKFLIASWNLKCFGLFHLVSGINWMCACARYFQGNLSLILRDMVMFSNISKIFTLRIHLEILIRHIIFHSRIKGQCILKQGTIGKYSWCFLVCSGSFSFIKFYVCGVISSYISKFPLSYLLGGMKKSLDSSAYSFARKSLV